MKKRVTSLLLVLAMLLSMLPAMAFAADETATEHAITVSGKTEYTTMQGAELVIKMTDLFTDSEIWATTPSSPTVRCILPTPMLANIQRR